jgi:hypothetical protein
MLGFWIGLWRHQGVSIFADLGRDLRGLLMADTW